MGVALGNHWNDDGDLVIEDKTLFRQVGWLGRSGTFYPLAVQPGKAPYSITSEMEPGGFAPVYEQIATWADGEGWKD